MAPPIDPSFISELSSRLDIEAVVSPYVKLKRQGRRFTGLCPFHSERSPSFTVYADTCSFYCFGCGAGGDAIAFIRKIENMEYIEAVKLLAAKVGMAIPEQDDPLTKLRLRIYEINRTAARFYHKQLISPTGKLAQSYILSRGLTVPIVKKFGLGYAEGGFLLTSYLQKCGYTEEELLQAALCRRSKGGKLYDSFANRIIFPIIDKSKRVIAFGGRSIGEELPKYLNSSDTPVYKKSNSLYALNLAKSTAREEFILCEGYMDTIALHSAGFDNAVATLGTALTEEQARLIARHTQCVIIAYDSDEAGKKATHRATGIFEQAGVQAKVLRLSGAKDPDEYIKKYGAEKLEKLIKNSVSAIASDLDGLYEKVDASTPEGRIELVKLAVPILAEIRSSIQRDIYISEVARKAEIDKSILTEQVKRQLNRLQKKAEKSAASEIFLDANPSSKGDFERKAKRKQAVALERLLLYLMENPSRADSIIPRIEPQDIVSKIDAELFAAICNCIAEGISPDISYLGAIVSESALSRISEIRAEAASVSAEDARSYIELLEELRQKRITEESTSLSDNDFAESFKKLAEHRRGR